MINNYYTLSHLVAEWQSRASSVALAQPFTQSKNELVLPFEPVGESASQDDAWVAIVSCEPSSNAVFFKDSYPRARRNSKDIFAGVEGALVGSVMMHPSDRQIRVALRTGSSLLIQFFGSRANVLLVGSDGSATDAFLRSRDVIGTSLDPWPAPTDPPTAEAIARRLAADPPIPLVTALKRAWPSFGPVLVREVLFKSGVKGTEIVNDVDPRTLASVAEVCRLVLDSVTGPPRPLVYYREKDPVEFTPVPLSHLAGLREEPQENISEGIRKFIGTSRSRSDLVRKTGRLVDALRAEAEQADTTRRRIQAEFPDAGEADDAERFGKLLQAHLTTLIKGQREAIVEDLFSTGREIIAIPLDPHLTPAKNAERYFDKARKIRTTVVEQRSRLEQLEQKLSLIGPLLAEAEEIGSEESWNSFVELHKDQLHTLGVRPGAGPQAAQEERRLPFRVFSVDGGFQVWAGKSGENNDLLTTRHTAKNDLWFHVRGAGGSHVVLKTGTGRGEVSRRAKEQAAAIAAFYSKMRKASHVPVAMCEGKYVRKPRGASTGTVTIERETVLFVDPHLPEEQ